MVFSLLSYKLMNERWYCVQITSIQSLIKGGGGRGILRHRPRIDMTDNYYINMFSHPAYYQFHKHVKRKKKSWRVNDTC